VTFYKYKAVKTITRLGLAQPTTGWPNPARLFTY